MESGRRVIAVFEGIVVCLAILPAVALGGHGSDAILPLADSRFAAVSDGDSLDPAVAGLSTDPGNGQITALPDTDTAGTKPKARRMSFLASPTGTLLKSVTFPGWGQWSNGKKQKAAVYFGIETYFITKALIWRHRARQNDDFATLSHARDRRNYFYWLTGLTIFISMFDAYADRYLLTLEQTRDRPDEFWGGQGHTLSTVGDGWRLLLGWRF